MKRIAVLLLAVASVGVMASGAVAAHKPTKASTPSAAMVIGDLAKAHLPVHLTIVFTASSDPNHLLGRPNGYVSKASFSDPRVPSSDTVGDSKGAVDFGGSVEVFPNNKDAQARAKYIESVEKADPIVGTEYDYLNGPVLLRISQYLTPTQAKPYRAALAKLKV